MARSIAEIQTQITDAYVSNMAAVGFTVDTTTWSASSIERLAIYAVAFCTNLLEQLYDLFRSDVDTALQQQKVPNAPWWRDKLTGFQYGFPLIPGTDLFDNTGYTDDQIEESKIIKYAAVVEQLMLTGETIVRAKLATIIGDDLGQLDNDQLAAVRAYMVDANVKPFGVTAVFESLPPDSLKQTWRIYYNPLILSADGSRVDGSTSTPVRDAIKTFLTVLSATNFNGLYQIGKHIDAVQAVEGVEAYDLDLCQVKFGAFDFSDVDTFYTPDAGYLRFADDEDLIITYIPFNNG